MNKVENSHLLAAKRGDFFLYWNNDTDTVFILIMFLRKRQKPYLEGTSFLKISAQAVGQVSQKHMS